MAVPSKNRPSLKCRAIPSKREVSRCYSEIIRWCATGAFVTGRPPGYGRMERNEYH